MSTTAGAGTQEYVAINPAAIGALLLGLSSVLVALSPLFLIVPAAGVICGIVAIVQIRHSNQTQAGTLLASLGLLLSLGLGGGKAAYDGLAALRTTDDERAITQLLHEFGQDLAAEQYDHAYQRFVDSFKDRVSLPTFEQTFKVFDDPAEHGTLRSLDWNQERMEIEENPDTGTTLAYAMAMFNFAKFNQPVRLIISFEKINGTWRLYDVQGLFQAKKKPS